MFYIILGFLASLAGALSGIGGSIIIKPLLDACTEMDAQAISFLSAATVFTMAAVSAGSHLYARTRFSFSTVLLGIGAVFGGFAGTELFALCLRLFGRDDLMKIVQNILLCILLVAILFYLNNENRKQFQIKNRAVILLTGFLLGALSAFLGIGGGPINVAVLCLLFSMDLKNAAAGSMILILFSQVSKLATVLLSRTMPPGLEPSLFLYMLPAAAVGSIFGTALNRKAGKRMLQISYNSILVFVIATCLYNVWYLVS